MRRFDKAAIFEAYRKWFYEEPGVTDHNVINLLSAFVDTEIEVKYGSYDPDIQDEIGQKILCDMWTAIRERKIDLNCPNPIRSFYGWMNWIVIAPTEIVAVRPALRDAEPEKIGRNYFDLPPSQDAVEIELLLEDLPQTILNRCLERASHRFFDWRLQCAAKHVLRQAAKMERVSRDWLRSRYKIKDPRFVIDYARMITRSELERLADEEFGLRTSSDKRRFVVEGLSLLEGKEHSDLMGFL